MAETPDLEFLRLQNADLVKRLEATRHSGGSGGGPYMPDMGERMGRIEGEVGGLKHSQSQMLVAVGVVSAVLIGVGIFTLSEVKRSIEKTNDLALQVSELPGKVSSSLLEISKTLADVIIAAKQPQQPTPPAPPPTPPKH